MIITLLRQLCKAFSKQLHITKTLLCGSCGSLMKPHSSHDTQGVLNNLTSLFVLRPSFFPFLINPLVDQKRDMADHESTKAHITPYCHPRPTLLVHIIPLTFYTTDLIKWSEKIKLLISYKILLFSNIQIRLN